MKGHHLCTTPVEYVKKVDVRNNDTLGDIRPKQFRNMKKCKASDPDNPSNICMTTTCSGR